MAIVAASAFTQAVPFLVNALLLLLSPFLGLAIQSRISGMFSQRFDDTRDEAAPWIDPQTLARTSIWIGDAAQILPTAIGPLVGLLLLRPGIDSALGLLYVASFAIAMGSFLGFTFLVDVAGYGYRGWRIPLFTPFVVGGTALNAIAAGIAAWIG